MHFKLSKQKNAANNGTQISKFTLTQMHTSVPDLKMKWQLRPITRILCGGVLTRPKWTKRPNYIFYVILFN